MFESLRSGHGGHDVRYVERSAQDRADRQAIEREGLPSSGHVDLRGAQGATLVSGSGRILWHYDVGDEGWPSLRSLVSRVHAALAHAQG